MTVPLLKIDQQLSALIGFAIKSRQLVQGYQAIVRAVQNKQIQLLIIHYEISKGTMNKLRKLSDKEKIFLIRTAPGTDWFELWGLASQRILGVSEGTLAGIIIQKVRAGV